MLLITYNILFIWAWDDAFISLILDIDTSSSTNKCFLASVPDLRNDASSDLDSVKIENTIENLDKATTNQFKLNKWKEE